MIFEDVLRDMLVSFNLVGTRIFLLRAPQVPTPQAVVPYMVFLPVGPEPLHTHQGPPTLVQCEYQFSFFDNSQSRAMGLSDALIARLDGLKAIYEGVDFGGIHFRSETSGYEDDTKLHQSITTFLIQYTLLAPLAAVSSRQLKQRQQIRKDNANL